MKTKPVQLQWKQLKMKLNVAHGIGEKRPE